MGGDANIVKVAKHKCQPWPELVVGALPGCTSFHGARVLLPNWLINTSTLISSLVFIPTAAYALGLFTYILHVCVTVEMHPVRVGGHSTEFLL